MKKRITYPFNIAIKELKKDNAFRKTLESKKAKSTLLAFMWQTCLYLLIMTIIYAYGTYFIIVSIFLYPLAILAVLVMLILRWVFTSGYKHIIGKSKENFLKHYKVYDQYLEVTKDIE